jgi:hypothetical protein
MDHATIADMMQRKTWFVKAGMTPEEALKTTTVNAAELLGQEESLARCIPVTLLTLWPSSQLRALQARAGRAIHPSGSQAMR